MTILRLLRGDAKAWWYHRDLRKAGKHTEARDKEHTQVRNNIKTLRDTIKSKGYGSVGRGGYSIHYIPSSDTITYGHSSLQGYGDINAPIMQAAIELGIPVYDSTVVPNNKIVECVKYPMIGLNDKIDPQPWHGLSYAPRKYVFELYEQLGAKVYNKDKL